MATETNRPDVEGEATRLAEEIEQATAEIARRRPGELIQVMDYESRENWLRARMAGVGASESAALFGVSPFHTPLSLWAEKTGKLQQEARDDEFLDWGQFLEEPIAQRYAAITGRTVWQGSPFCIAQHSGIREMIATPDRWVIKAPDRGTPGLLQVKNAGWYKSDEWEDGPPDYVQIQCQHEMAVTGRQWHSVAVLIGGNRWRYFDIDRNPDVIAELEVQVQLFWHRVVTRTPPPPGEIDHRAIDTLKRLHPADNGETVELPDDALEWWVHVEAARKAATECGKIKDEYESKLRLCIGDATYGRLLDGRRLSLKTSSRDGYTVNPTTFRTLRLEKGSK